MTARSHTRLRNRHRKRVREFQWKRWQRLARRDRKAGREPRPFEPPDRARIVPEGQ